MNITPERAQKIAIIINNSFWALWAAIVIVSWFYPMVAVWTITLLFARDLVRLVPWNSEEDEDG